MHTGRGTRHEYKVAHTLHILACSPERSTPQQEHRACAALKRELSRDAAFMGEARRQERMRAAAARDRTARRDLAFLEQQEADFRSGGQGGMNPHRASKKKAKGGM